VVIGAEFFYSFPYLFLKKKQVFNVCLLKGRLYGSPRKRENEMTLQFFILGGKMNPADIGGGDLEGRMREWVLGEKNLKFIDHRIHTSIPLW